MGVAEYERDRIRKQQHDEMNRMMRSYEQQMSSQQNALNYDLGQVDSRNRQVMGVCQPPGTMEYDQAGDLMIYTDDRGKKHLTTKNYLRNKANQLLDRTVVTVQLKPDKPVKRNESNMAWLDRRVNEMRVKL